MTNVFTLVNGTLQENCYVVTKNDIDCIIIDPGLEYDKIRNFINEKQLKIKAILLTHGHYDHVGTVAFFQDTDLKIYIHENDENMLTSSIKSLAVMMGESMPKAQADVILSGGEKLFIADFKIDVLHTPGHTAGSVCYIFDDEFMFSGDTIFYSSYGRYDLPGGSKREIIDSIKNKIFSINKNLKIYPGHDISTTLDFEKQNNPVLLMKV